MRALSEPSFEYRNAAADQLAAADGSVKLALLMTFTGLGVQEASELLAGHGASLRAALANESWKSNRS